MEQFRIIGYYIVEVIDTPKWLSGISNHMLSVSSCIGEIHPKWQTYIGGWKKGEEREYQNKLKMSDGQYKDFSKTVNQLFISKRLDVDGRFPYLSDARRFYDNYYDEGEYKLVSISTFDKYLEILAEELKGSNAPINGEADGNLPLGSDILGWDISGFHSFLCNSLHNDLLTVKFNHIGLLENDFEEVVQFACKIEGTGEPVEWIPCRVGKC